jgi:hypothetical protein
LAKTQVNPGGMSPPAMMGYISGAGKQGVDPQQLKTRNLRKFKKYLDRISR